MLKKIGKVKQKDKKKNYLQNDALTLYFNDTSKTNWPVIDILKNGNKLNLKIIHIGDKN